MKLNYQAPIGRLGYGQVGGYLLNALDKAGVDISYFPLGQPEPQKFHLDVVQKAYQNQIKFDVVAPSLKIWHEFMLAERVGKGIHAALPFFEINKFDERRLVNINSCDVIVSASKWGTRILQNNNVTPRIVTIPMGVDSNIFHPNYVVKRNPDITRFFNVNKIEVRKGHHELIEAFNAAFEPKDNVELYLLWHNPFLTAEENSEWEGLAKNSKMGHKIFIVPPMTSNEEVASLMNNCDCAVCPTKSEGYGLSLLESLSCGKLLITTDYGAQTEFANNSNSLIINIDNLTSAYDGKWFHGQGEWADFGDKQMEQLINHLRFVANLPIDQKYNHNGIETSKSFSWDHTANLLISELLC